MALGLGQARRLEFDRTRLGGAIGFQRCSSTATVKPERACHCKFADTVLNVIAGASVNAVPVVVLLTTWLVQLLSNVVSSLSIPKLQITFLADDIELTGLFA